MFVEQVVLKDEHDIDPNDQNSILEHLTTCLIEKCTGTNSRNSKAMLPLVRVKPRGRGRGTTASKRGKKTYSSSSSINRMMMSNDDDDDDDDDVPKRMNKSQPWKGHGSILMPSRKDKRARKRNRNDSQQVEDVIEMGSHHLGDEE
ncbi:hypothetical protein Tco_0238203, partial [Tanacetum coccineum]